MAGKVILVDTSILIDYYRKTNKLNTVWIKLIDKGYDFAISTITKYELFSGSTSQQIDFWQNVLSKITIISFDESCVDAAVLINGNLKRKRKQIDIADLFIAATAITHNLSIATLNKSHFERIEELEIIE